MVDGTRAGLGDGIMESMMRGAQGTEVKATKQAVVVLD